MPVTLTICFVKPSPKSRVSITWMTSPEPSSPASVSGVSVVVALWLIALATAFKTLVLWNGATLKTWGLDAKYDTNPMKHAICNSSDSAPSEPPAPLPPASRWSRPVRIRHSHHLIIQAPIYKALMPVVAFTTLVTCVNRQRFKYQ